MQVECYWKKQKEDDVKPSLVNINLDIKPGSLNAIIGPIGSGKSTLFMALLREIPFLDGKLEFKGKIAYVE